MGFGKLVLPCTVLVQYWYSSKNVRVWGKNGSTRGAPIIAFLKAKIERSKKANSFYFLVSEIANQRLCKSLLFFHILIAVVKRQKINKATICNHIFEPVTHSLVIVHTILLQDGSICFKRKVPGIVRRADW